MSNKSPFKGYTITIPYYISDKLELLNSLNKYKNVEILHFELKVEKDITVYIKIAYDINTNIKETIKLLSFDIITYSDNNRKENFNNVLLTKRSIGKYLSSIITLNSIMDNEDDYILFRFNMLKKGIHYSVKEFINFMLSKYIDIVLYKESLNACGQCNNSYRVVGRLKKITTDDLIYECKYLFKCDF